MTATTERPVADQKKKGRPPTDNVRVPADFNDKMLALAKDAGFKSVSEWLKTTEFYEWVSVEYRKLLKKKLAEEEKRDARRN